MEKETLEGFIQRQLSLGNYQDQESAIRCSIELGVKWQAEQDKNFYNKEDLWESYKASNTIFEDEIALRQEFEKWFENFKNK